MPKYLSAEALQITEGERKWLIKTEAVLATLRPRERKKVDGLSLAFHMNKILEGKIKADRAAPCNSAGCIKGWMSCLAVTARKGLDLNISSDIVDPRKEMEKDKYPWSDTVEPEFTDWNESLVLADLFYPATGLINYDLLTPKQAATAIRSFLQTGQICWPK